MTIPTELTERAIAWLSVDYEVRSITIDVRIETPADWDEGGAGEPCFRYGVEGHSMLYVKCDTEDGYTAVTYAGHGYTVNEAVNNMLDQANSLVLE